MEFGQIIFSWNWFIWFHEVFFGLDFFLYFLAHSDAQSIYNNNGLGANSKKALKNNSKNTKRFWKRKNRSRSPSRSVGRSETEEVFTSSEDDISSISIDDVSSDDESSDEADDTDAEEVWDEVKESVTSVTNSNDVNDQDLDNVSDDDADEEEEECSSLASDLSWFQDHYYTTEDPRYYIISDWRIFIYCIRLRESKSQFDQRGSCTKLLRRS